jgi:Ca-activated chloride channel homolog
MRNLLILTALSTIVGCASGAASLPNLAGDAKAPSPGQPATGHVLATSDPGEEPADRKSRTSDGAWIGAAAEGDLLLSGTRETFLGVWVDAPEERPAERPPMDLALVIDTSGSMAGAKIDNARRAASTLVNNLREGDIVTVDSFDDRAEVVVAPTRIDAHSRSEVLRRIAALRPRGSTNMFAGLTLAKSQIAAAPPTHTIRRVVVISDGIANVGPSSPEALGSVAEQGLRFRAQVTSLGVGNDYDEKTLNALAVRSSGRLYHLSEPREMASILERELELLDATVASEAFVEISPAAGVLVEPASGTRTEWQSGGSGSVLRIPLGALHAGQHREALVRVRLTDPSAFEARARPLASVRLRFRDAQDSDLERIHEVVARTQLSSDEAAVARSVSSRTKAIVALHDAANVQMQAAQRINEGQFVDADRELEVAERRLSEQARVVTAPHEKKRLEVAARQVAQARASTRAMPAKPKATQRDEALQMNAGAMKALGF